MNLKTNKKIVNSVIENEFYHILECKEVADLAENQEIVDIDNKRDKILEKLYKVAPEHDELIGDYESTECEYWTRVIRYYFKMGVIAGATNLSFLKDTGIIEYI
ncbi:MULTISPECIES: hypothetical protein [unclassified Clostridium]|uniref:hypothetical protein n=1 Tax=unclassified Clostridium TaxID=2614128 RepID=UPI00207A1A4C|nr:MULTISPECIES: hypothetical protein [unclassified Clostridium]